MKKAALLLFIALTKLNLEAQEPNAEIDLSFLKLNPDVSKLTIEEARVIVQSPKSSRMNSDVVNFALSSRRIKLIQLCFEDQEVRLHLFSYRPEAPYSEQPLAQIPDELFRDEIVAMMIGSNCWWWPSEKVNVPRPSSAGRIGPTTLLREPFVTTIKKYFPALPLTEELLATRATRLQLAADLTKAIAKAKEHSHSPTPTPTTIPATQSSSQQQSQIIPPKPPQDSTSSSWSLWLALLAGVLALIGWKRSKRKA